MKKISKIVKSAVFAVLAVCMLFGVVACDNTEGPSGDIFNEDRTPTVAGKIEVSARREAYPNATAQAGVRSWVADFQKKYPDVTVKLNFGVSESNYPQLFSSGTIGDVYALHDEVVYSYAITHEALLPIDYYIEKFDIDLSQVYNGIYQLGVVNGMTYMAAATCGQQTLIYNVDAVKAANVLPEGQEKVSNTWTWDDFKTYAAALTQVDPETQQYTQVAAYLPIGHSHYYSPFLVGFGGQWVDTVNKKVTLTSDEVLVGITELLDACEQGYILPAAISMGSEWTDKFAKINPEQNTVFQFNAAYTNVVTKGQTLDKLGINWDIATFPLFEYNASPCGTLGFGVFSGSGNPDAAAALVCSLYTVDGQTAFHSQTGGDIPTIKSLGDDDFWHLKQEGWEDKNYSAFTANYERYIPGHIKASVPEDIADIIHTQMNALFTSWYNGTADIQVLLEQMEQTANDKWATLS